MKCCCVKMADEVVGKSRSNGSITKARTTFPEEETENLISVWSEEEILFNSRHKDYFKKDVRQNAINRILLRLDKHSLPRSRFLGCHATLHPKEAAADIRTAFLSLYWPIIGRVPFLGTLSRQTRIVQSETVFYHGPVWRKQTGAHI